MNLKKIRPLGQFSFQRSSETQLHLKYLAQQLRLTVVWLSPLLRAVDWCRIITFLNAPWLQMVITVHIDFVSIWPCILWRKGQMSHMGLLCKGIRLYGYSKSTGKYREKSWNPRFPPRNMNCHHLEEITSFFCCATEALRGINLMSGWQCV